jgi:hypothetical protein
MSVVRFRPWQPPHPDKRQALFRISRGPPGAYTVTQLIVEFFDLASVLLHQFHIGRERVCPSKEYALQRAKGDHHSSDGSVPQGAFRKARDGL